jgi:hypothetical protein
MHAASRQTVGITLEEIAHAFLPAWKGWLTAFAGTTPWIIGQLFRAFANGR